MHDRTNDASARLQRGRVTRRAFGRIELLVLAAILGVMAMTIAISLTVIT